MSKIHSNYLKTNDDVELHYLQSGSGETIIMLPGAGFNAHLFKYQIEYFSQNYDVISLDKRGHGKSEKVNYGYRTSRFGKDLDDLIRHLKLEKAFLI